MDACAAQASFWILISLIPFLMFALTLLQTVRFEDTTLLFAFVKLLPSPVNAMLQELFSTLRAPSGLLSATVVLCVWSASNGMQALIKGLYAVFDIGHKPGFIRMRATAIFYTLAFAAVLLLSLGVLFFGDRLFTQLDSVALPAVSVLVGILRPFSSFAVLLFFFWLLFVGIPRKKVRSKSALAGAAFSAAGWVLFSFFFSVFVENFSNYATIYGSLTAIIILMMWLYFCMYILLIGGEVSMWLQHSSVRQDLRTLYYSRRLPAQKGQFNGKKTKK